MTPLAPGPNHISDSSFEAGTTSYGINGPAPATGRTTALAWHGSYSLSHAVNAGTVAGAGPFFGAGTVTPGKSYTASVQVRSTNGQPVYIAIEWFKADGSWSSVQGAIGGYSGPTSTTGWTKISVTGVAPSDAARSTMVVYTSETAATSGTLYYDAIQYNNAYGPSTYVP